MNPFLQQPKGIDWNAINVKPPVKPKVVAKTPFDATPLGIAKNTVLGLPKATKDVAIDIGRSITRSAASAGLTVAKPLGGVDTLESSDMKSLFGQELFKNFFGTEPVKAIEDNIAQAEIGIKQNPFAKKTGLDKFALPLAFGGVFGSDALNLTPFGGLEKNATKQLVKEGTLEGVMRVLKQLGVSPEVATQVAPDLAKAKTSKEVQDIFDIMKGLEGTKAKAEAPLPRPTTPEEAATRYYNDVLKPSVDSGEAPVIEADNLKTYFGKDYAPESHPTYSKAAFQLYERALKESPHPDVAILGGGPGSGKTELLTKSIKESGFKGVIYDSNSASFEGLQNALKAARNAGKNPEIYGVIPDLERARGFTISRELASGRGVTDEAFARGHAGFPEAIQKAIESGDIEASKVHLVDTRGFKTAEDVLANATRTKDPLALVKSLGYNEEHVRGYYSKTSYTQRNPGASQQFQVQNRVEKALAESGSNSARQRLENLNTEISIREDAIQSMPGSGLSKYVSRTTGELPEVTGKVKMRSLTGSGKNVKTSNYGRKGDDIAAQHGFEDAASAQEAVDAYKAERQNINELKAEAAALKKSIASEKPVAKSARPVGEGASSVAKADQALQALSPRDRREVSSLMEIVGRRNIEVKQKINIIDYLRTPDRVLEKIGFGKEAKTLRRGYESYVKELPQNIEKISGWAKQVPKESAKKLFQYLDGEDVALTDTERKVAGEMRDWLKEWAHRLKLPEDKRITSYITHIFDKELIQKEFDEDLAKIITDKIPGSVYDPFLLKRLGAKGYVQDVFRALDAYVKRGTRKVYMDPPLEAIQRKAGSSLEMSNIEVSQWKYLQKYIAGVNMRPTDLDNLIDNTIKSVVGYKYGQRPITYLTKLLRQLTYRGLLGINPGSALRNLSQGVNTYAVLGEKYTAIGYMKLFSSGAFEELTREGVMAENFIQDRNLSSTRRAMEKFDKFLFYTFELAERINRGSAYFGAKSKALGQGKSLPEAVEYAKEIVRKTQFSFGSIDTPVAIQSDIVKSIAQLQNYTLKQTEFLAEMVKDKNFVGLLRYGVAGMIFVYTAGRAFGMQPKDLVPTFRFDTPPSLKFPVEAAKAVFNTPDKFGRQRTFGQKASDVGKSAIGLIPGGAQAKKSIEGAIAYNQGKDVTAGGNTRYEIPQDFTHFIQALLFGKSSLPEAQDYYDSLKKPAGTTKKADTSDNPFLK